MSRELSLQVQRDFVVWTRPLVLVIWFGTPVESQDPVHPLSTVGPQDPTALSTAVKGVIGDMEVVIRDVSWSVISGFEQPDMCPRAYVFFDEVVQLGEDLPGGVEPRHEDREDVEHAF